MANTEQQLKGEKDGAIQAADVLFRTGGGLVFGRMSLLSFQI